MPSLKEIAVDGETYYYLVKESSVNGEYVRKARFIGTKKPTEKQLATHVKRFAQEIPVDTTINYFHQNLITILQHLQDEKGYLAKEDFVKLAKEHNIPLVDLVGIATFYSQFTLTKPGKHTIRVCNGTACHLKKAPSLIRHVEQKLGISCGQVTPDGLIGLESVNCIGACALAPAVMINDKIHGNITDKKLDTLIKELQ